MFDDVVKALIKTVYDGKGVKEAKQDFGDIDNKAKTTGSNLNKAFEVGKFAVFGAAIKRTANYIADVSKRSADYIETLNVLQVAFDGNTESIRKFSSNLADTLNLDDSTIISAAAHFKTLTKSMGIATDTGEKLSELMTKMTLDLSSLYNIDFDKAQTALQYAMEGRGTSLKQRTGVSVLESSVQTTLDTIGVDAYVKDMNDAEKAIARVITMEYQLMSSQGDLARTIEAPANQMRVMGEQISMLARNIGNVLLPIVARILPYFNAILIVLNAIISALARLVGYKEGMFDTFEGSNTIDYFDGVGSAIDGVGKSADKTAKKLQGLRSFDKLNVIKSPTDTGGGAGGAGGGGAGGINPNLLKAFNSMADQYKMKLEEVKTKATEIAEKILTWLGFQKRINEETGKTEWYYKGIGDGSSAIVKSFENIKKSLIDIFTSPEVIKASEKWANSVTTNLSKVANSVLKIGTNIVEFLFGSMEKYLAQNGKRIKKYIVEMFNITREDMNITGSLYEAFGTLSEVLQNDISKQIGADIIAMFYNPLMSLSTLLANYAVDLRGVFTAPFIDNINEIKKTIEGLLPSVQTVTGTMASAFTYMGETLTDTYNKHAAPYFDSLKTGLSDTFGKFLEVYNKYFKPFVDETAADLKELWDKHLKKLWDNLTEMIGAIIDRTKEYWDIYLKPFIDWCIQNILPLLLPILRMIKDTVFNTIAVISDIISSLIKKITGIIQFLTGVFTGNWKKAWEGIVNVFKGIFDGIVGIVKSPLNQVINIINNFTQSLKNIKIPDWIPKIGGKPINIPRIPHLAEGGMPEQGQMFIANERGAELVGQIGGQTFVANQNQMLDIIDKKLQNAGGLKNATFIVQVGDEQVAKKVLKDLNGMAASNGKPIKIGG